MVGDILQPTHLLFVLIVALLVLGPKRLPEVGRALGRGLRDFRSAISGEETPERTISAPAPSPAAQEPSSSSAEPSPAPPEAQAPTGAQAPTEVEAPTDAQAPTQAAEPVTSSASTQSGT